ncbi:helix-turn-helix domain-containing protein [Paenibacillus sp. RRE4]|uniref:helix-turn-helix domain-containing protein n=1 Tax=Paenibacillus sp. RRE4 TaxID=2962587 RepID=UPI002880FBAB|nr:helix-turn-helix domain-containing protein [Paenibacillus sp. RRE4]MDT0122878.1 helix-turn-helix domain-containing protein [Paenibacillus sp. RRE4]
MKLLWSKFSPMFRRYLISYLIILMIPQIAGYASYRASIEAARASSIENSLKSLNLGKEIIERNLLQVEAFTRQLAINQELYRLIADPKPLDAYNVYGIGKMQRSLSMYSSTNEYLSHFFIYIPNYNVIITPNTVYYRPEHYYAANALEGMTFEQWSEQILKKPHFNEIIPLQNYKREISSNLRTTAPAITFLQSLPLNSFNKPQATIGVLIDEDEMASLTQHIVDQYGGWTLVRDANGEIIFSRGIDEGEAQRLAQNVGNHSNEVQPIEVGRLLISIHSDRNGWSYMAGIPEKALMTNADQIKKVTLAFTLATLTLGLGFGLILAYRNSAPIYKLLSAFREQVSEPSGKRRNEYDFLASHIHHLIANNQSLENALNEQIPLLRDGFIKRLLTGEFYTTRELEAISSQTQLSIENSQGITGLLKVNGYASLDSEETIQELGVAKLMIRQTMTAWNADVLMTDWGTDQIAFICPVTKMPLEPAIRHCESELSRLTELIYKEYRISTTIGTGAAYEVWNDVGRSFDEAKQAMEYAIHMGVDELVRFEDTLKENEMYYYPIESEQRLLNTIKAGELEEALRILDQLFVRNFEERELSYEMAQQFIMELKGTYLKLDEPKIKHDDSFAEEYKNGVTSIQITDSIAALRGKFKRLTEDMCKEVLRKRSSTHADTVQEITCYIENQYGDANLTICRISEHMGKSEKFISQLFKEHTGENLSDYVERVRINAASELLRESHQTIDEIALSTGYNSAHSFRRAFKRVRGISPSVFRKMDN